MKLLIHLINLFHWVNSFHLVCSFYLFHLFICFISFIYFCCFIHFNCLFHFTCLTYFFCFLVSLILSYCSQCFVSDNDVWHSNNLETVNFIFQHQTFIIMLLISHKSWFISPKSLSDATLRKLLIGYQISWYKCLSLSI